MSVNADKKPKMPIFRDRLDELRGDMSYSEFAEKLGISRATMGFYLAGDRVPNAVDLKRIAEKCEVPTDWLLGLSDYSNAEKRNLTVEDLGLPQRFVLNLLHQTSFLNGTDKEMFVAILSEPDLIAALVVAAGLSGFPPTDSVEKRGDAVEIRKKYRFNGEENQNLLERSNGMFCICPSEIATEATISLALKVFDSAIKKAHRSHFGLPSYQGGLNGDNPEAR